MDQFGLARWVLNKSELENYERLVKMTDQYVYAEAHYKDLLPILKDLMNRSKETFFEASNFEQGFDTPFLSIVRFSSDRLGYNPNEDGVVFVSAHLVGADHHLSNGKRQSGYIFAYRYHLPFEDGIGWFSFNDGGWVPSAITEDDSLLHTTSLSLGVSTLKDLVSDKKPFVLFGGGSLKVYGLDMDMGLSDWSRGVGKPNMSAQRVIIFKK